MSLMRIDEVGTLGRSRSETVWVPSATEILDVAGDPCADSRMSARTAGRTAEKSLSILFTSHKMRLCVPDSPSGS